jgi:hypothetical protein
MRSDDTLGFDIHECPKFIGGAETLGAKQQSHLKRWAALYVKMNEKSTQLSVYIATIRAFCSRM